MQLHAEQSVSEDNECIFTVFVPPTRSDVLHACDVAEDVAIAYGFNKIPQRTPASIKPLPLNQFSDLIRTELAIDPESFVGVQSVADTVEYLHSGKTVGKPGKVVVCIDPSFSQQSAKL